MSSVLVSISTVMGARESTAGGGQAEQGGEGIVDYYKILEVAEDATQDEIKVGTLRLIRNLNSSSSRFTAFFPSTGSHPSSRQESWERGGGHTKVCCHTTGLRGEPLDFQTDQSASDIKSWIRRY